MQLKSRWRLAKAMLTLAVYWGANSALAQAVDIRDAWVRTTVPGQRATGAFMKITARENLRLVSLSSPLAGVAQIHSMSMDGGVMKMRALDEGIELPAGKAVELKPGANHIMLMDLKAALPNNSSMPLTLVFKDAKGVQSQVELKLPVSASGVVHKH